MKILIGADLVPTETNAQLFSDGNIEQLIGSELASELENSDVRVFDLETPLIEKESPIKKAGPNFGVTTKVVNGIKKLNPSFLTLANNHIMDHDVLGLNSTIVALNEKNIDFGGVGNNLKEANKMWIKEFNGIKLGIYACAEHEYSIAEDNKPGANPFDYIDSYKCIEDNKSNCDFIIVLYHGGKEYYPYPSPKLQKVCRNFIDKGADFVVCQHSHCIGSEETYNGKKIVYGQGNFLFDRTNRVEWNHGLLLQLNVEKTSYDLDYIVLTKVGNCIRKATQDEYDDVITKYKERSQKLIDDNFVKKSYKKFASENFTNVLRRIDLFPSSFVGRVLNKLANKKFSEFYFRKIYLKKMKYMLQNSIECEAWRELLEEILDNN